MAGSSYIEHEVSAFSSPEDVSHALQKIDEEIRALQTRRNSLALISRLPPEILAKIFKCLKYEECRYGYVKRWMVSSHICSHWRRVALECITLWTHFRFQSSRYSEKLVLELLERSRSAPLSLDVTHHDSMGAALSVLKNMDRIRTLRLSRIRHYFDQDLLDVLERSPAPLLEQFEMYIMSSVTVNYLPDILFSGHFPRLHKLNLSGCSVSWASSVFNQLTHLTICYTPSTAIYYHPTANHLISMLANMPNLTTLNLRDAIPPYAADNEVSTTPQTITLPHLLDIEIWLDIPSCIYLLCQLSFPAEASIKVHSLKETNFIEFLDVFRTIFGGTDNRFGFKPTIHCLQIQFSEYDQFIFKAWNTSGSIEREPVGDPQIHIKLKRPQDHLIYQWNGSEEEFWDILPLNALQHLRLFGIVDFSGFAWLNFGGRLDQLVMLSISDLVEYDLLQILSLKRTKRVGKPPLYFPALRELSISKWCSIGSQISDDTGIWQKLIDCVRERHQIGAGLQKLYFHGCGNLSEGDIRKLEGAVPEVFWEVEDTDEDSEDESGDEDIDEDSEDGGEDEDESEDEEDEDEDEDESD